MGWLEFLGARCLVVALKEPRFDDGHYLSIMRNWTLRKMGKIFIPTLDENTRRKRIENDVLYHRILITIICFLPRWGCYDCEIIEFQIHEYAHARLIHLIFKLLLCLHNWHGAKQNNDNIIRSFNGYIIIASFLFSNHRRRDLIVDVDTNGGRISCFVNIKKERGWFICQ